MEKDNNNSVLTRRDALARLGLLGLVGSSMALVGCSGSSSSSNANSTSVSDSTDSSDTGSGDTGTGDSGTGSAAWASGGTSLITAEFPDDSLFETTAAACSVALTSRTTEGPCYFADDTGEDISEGQIGLPMQLCLQLQDSECNPLSGYTIEVWHCDREGLYSGDTSSSSDSSRFAGGFCTGSDAEAEKSTWFRGQLTTNSSGRVNFKTCFPGWYSSRVIHVHFRVTAPDGSESVVSQFCFTDEFAKEICTEHELYRSRGEQDTTLAGGDNVFPSSNYEEYLLNTEQNSDNTLLAYHTIRIP